LDGNFQAFEAHFHKQINSPEFAQMHKSAENLLEKIHDRSAFNYLLTNLNTPNNTELDPLIDCVQNGTNCTADGIISILNSVQAELNRSFVETFKMSKDCSADLSYHWASVIKLIVAMTVEGICASEGPACDKNGTTMTNFTSILEESLWSLTRT
jgi:hypothetical protein